MDLPNKKPYLEPGLNQRDRATAGLGRDRPHGKPSKIWYCRGFPGPASDPPKHAPKRKAGAGPSRLVGICRVRRSHHAARRVCVLRSLRDQKLTGQLATQAPRSRTPRRPRPAADYHARRATKKTARCSSDRIASLSRAPRPTYGVEYILGGSSSSNPFARTTASTWEVEARRGECARREGGS